LVQVKYEMLRPVRVDKRPVSQAAKEFGFSRPSFYQAEFAFEQSGLSGLLPEKRGPRSGHKLTPEVMKFVAEQQAAQPSLSFAQLAEAVKQNFNLQVHPRSIERQLLREKKRR
jgi:transposase